MDYSVLSHREIIGTYYRTLAIGPAPWIPAVSMKFNSDQKSEEYKWLGQVPVMREWNGGRNPKGLRTDGFEIKNKRFEATLEFDKDDLRRDKTGQTLVRIRELARRTNSHWAMLLSELVQDGSSTVCYDNQNFFDTDHAEGKSGTQSNSITFDISDDAASVPSGERGTYLKPGVQTAALAILKSIQQIISFKDDQGEPINEDATSFLVMAPIALWMPLKLAVTLNVVGQSVTNALAAQKDLDITVVPNIRLTGTSEFFTFRTDSDLKPFIAQEETGVEVETLGEGSTNDFMERIHYFGVTAARNVGYGMWQNACKTTLQD